MWLSAWSAWNEENRSFDMTLITVEMWLMAHHRALLNSMRKPLHRFSTSAYTRHLAR